MKGEQYDEVTIMAGEITQTATQIDRHTGTYNKVTSAGRGEKPEVATTVKAEPAKEAITENQPEKVDREKVAVAADDMNRYAQNISRNLDFSVDEASGETVIRVTDSETKELVRQIPSEEVLAMAKRMDEQSSSMLLDVTA